VNRAVIERVANQPKRGDWVHHPRFAGGARLAVTQVKEPTGFRAQRVAVCVSCDDGHAVNMPTRVWAIPTWADMVRGADLVNGHVTGAQP
jgi:hypothetical protein